MTSKRILSLVPVLLLTIALTASSEEKEEEFLLEDIVVTATRTEMSAAVAPGSISVVTNEDIEIRNIQSIDQALNTLPGVTVLRRSEMDSRPEIILRGVPYGKGRTLVLMDGLTINDTTLGSLWGTMGLAPENIKQIEVVKGPFSSLYGGNAMGGVVNIITKMPEKRGIILKTGYGTSWHRGEAADDLFRYYASYGDKFDKFSFFLSYEGKSINGFPTTYNVQSAQPTDGITGWSETTDARGSARYLIGDKGDETYWDDNITIKAGYDFSKTSNIRFLFNRNRWERHYDEPHTYMRDVSGNSVWSYGTVGEITFLDYQDHHVEQELYAINFETEISKVKIKSSFSLVEATYRNSGVPAGRGDSDHPDLDHYNGDLQFTVPLFERHLLTFGGSVRHSWGIIHEWDSTRTLIHDSRGKDMTYGLFAQDEITLLDNLTAYIGFREDWWKTYDGYDYVEGVTEARICDSANASSFSPKLALVYRAFEGTTLRASAGKAFRSPIANELYLSNITPYGIIYAANPDVKPETAKLWDIGVEQELWEGAKIKAAYFENYMKGFIQLARVSSTLFEYQNVGKSESKGVELEVEQIFDNWLRLFTNFTFTDSEVTENTSSPTSVGKSLTMLPKKQFNIGADLTRGPFSASLIGRYQSKIYSYDDNSDAIEGVYGSYDEHFTASAKVSYNIMKFMTLSLSVENIFDKDYFIYAPAPGRSWFCELAFRY